MMRTHFRWMVGLAVLGAATLACALTGGGDEGTTASGGQPFVGGNCDARSTRIEFDRGYDEQMHATTDPYPANCLYYCLWIPEDQDRLEVSLEDFSTDLDLYIGYGSFEAVTGEELVEGESFNWKSNAAGTDDEQVRIYFPEGGVYYIEVCSYSGEASSFRLSSDLR